MISVPQVIPPSSYYKPNEQLTHQTINVLPTATKALNQQVGPSNIKNYLSYVKTATIDLSANLPPVEEYQPPAEPQRRSVRFSERRDMSVDHQFGRRNEFEDDMANNVQRITSPV